MGLIKAAVGSFTEILADQWREYYYCDSLNENVLVAKGQKRTSSRSQNTKGADNIISNGAVIAVNVGQAMMIVDQGQIVEFAADAGEFTWNSSTEGSFFYDGASEGLKKSWEVFKRRTSFGGDTAKDQRIYFFNMKLIEGNMFGTPSPIPFRIVDRNIGLDMDTFIRCNGVYSYLIEDPMLFYKNVCGNVTENYTRDRLDKQLKTEFISALQPALGQISAMEIRFNEISNHTEEIASAMNVALSKKWGELRGLKVASVAMNPPSPPADVQELIRDLQTSAVYRNPTMAAAHMVQAQAEAMKTAAANENGAMMGFMGMNMAQAAGGMNANQLFQMGQQQPFQQPAPAPQAAPAAPAAPAVDGWTCACGATNTGKFCVECGGKKPEPKPDGWQCSCGSINKGKFCPECGAKKPASEPLYRCDKCGWEPKDPKNPPKFCPECGDRFDETDIQ